MAIDIKAHDIQVDEDGELIFNNGDFVKVVSNDEHSKAIIYSFTGDWIQYPQVGCNIQDYLNSNIPNNLLQVIKNQLVIDGFVVDSLEIDKTMRDAKIYLKARRTI